MEPSVPFAAGDEGEGVEKEEKYCSTELNELWTEVEVALLSDVMLAESAVATGGS
jgi:hypothetical protein